MAKFAQSASFSCGLASLCNSQVEDNKSTKDSSASTSDDKLSYFSHTNGQHVRHHVFSPGHKVSSGRVDKNSNSNGLANVSGNELGYISHARQNKFKRK